MIIKDEPVDRLVMLIDFLRPLVSQFSIVDTGSQDYERDKPLLETAGAQVCQVDWRNDFAWARNQTLQYLSTDWVLHLDADEFVSMGLVDWLRSYDASPQTMGYLIFTRNFWGGEWGIEVDAHWHCRLFRNGHGQWYKPLHEQVALDGKHEDFTRDTIVLPKAPKDAYIIHSKPRDKIEVSAELYKQMENR